MLRTKITAVYEKLSSACRVLGFPENNLDEFDKALEFFIRKENCDAAQLDKLTFLEWINLKQALPRPHKICIAISPADTISNEEEQNEQDFAEFKRRLAGGKCRIEIRLDKEQICEELNLNSATVRGRLFFFHKALESLLANTLDKPALLEDALWGNTPNVGLIIAVRDIDVAIQGPWVKVFGGAELAKAEGATHEIERPTIQRAESVFEAGRSQVRWECGNPPRFLTPRHLRIDTIGGQAAVLERLLLCHWVNLCLFYVGRRTAVSNGKVVAQLQTKQRRCQIQLFSGGNEMVSFSDRVRSLGDCVEWAYEDKLQHDRFRMLQIQLTREFASRKQPILANQLTTRAPAIWRDIGWQWEAFIENKLDEFSKESSEFEEDITNTVEAYDEQVGEIIKGLSAAVVAAIGVLVGAIIAAITGNSVPIDAIRKALYAYIAYLFVAPGAFSVWHHWARFTAMGDLFEKRRERFAKLLPESYVQELCEKHINGAKNRFGVSMLVNLFVLGIAALACFLLATKVASFRTH